MILDAASRSRDENTRRTLQIVRDEGYLEMIRQQGFVSHVRVQHNDSPGRTSAIAVPVFVGERLEASLALIYFDLVMRDEEAIERYIDRLKDTS